jgi:TolB protein
MSENGRRKCHFEFADLRLYPDERLLTKNEERVSLTPRVMDLLILLVEHEGVLVTKDVVLESVWQDSYVDESNVARTVSTLRTKLGVQESGGDFIETVPKLGYRFIAPVRKVEPAVVDLALDRSEHSRRNESFTPASPKWRLMTAAAAGGWSNDRYHFGLVYTTSITCESVNVDGLTNLTNNLGDDDLPSWSPDGKKIAFTSNRDGTGDIYVMNADGGGIIRLTDTPAAESSSVWSPDGTKIVFDSARDGNKELYIMNSDGSNQTRLTFNATTDVGPVSFSPDGKRIAFSRSAAKEGAAASYNFDIYVMNLNGSGYKAADHRSGI